MKHWLVGYDQKTEFAVYAEPVPSGLMDRIKSLVAFDDDDPEGIGCYELTAEEAEEVAHLFNDGAALPDGLDFFLEASAAALGE